MFQFARRHDTPIGLYLGGRLGAKLKELVSCSTVWQLGFEGRRPGALTLKVKDAQRRQLLSARSGQPAGTVVRAK
jgi:hypothetical protein